MLAHVLVHVRPSGPPTVVTPLPFAELAVAGADYDAAAAELRPILRERLRALEPVDRVPFGLPVDADLMRVPIEVQVDGDAAGALTVTVAIVVVHREMGNATIPVGYVPVIPGMELVQPDGDLDALADRLAPRIAARLRSWTAAAVLNVDEPPDTGLHFVEVDVDEDDDAPETKAAEPSQSTIFQERGTDLTRRTLGFFDGRDELVDRVIAYLADPNRSSVVLVGQPDVGKSALIYEVARRIRRGKVPKRLEGRKVWRLTANELIAGARYTGMWQEFTRHLVADGRRTRAVIAMGDPTAIIEAGQWSESSNNVSRYLRPYIENGDITVICECTLEQLVAAELREPGFIAAFHRVDIP